MPKKSRSRLHQARPLSLRTDRLRLQFITQLKLQFAPQIAALLDFLKHNPIAQTYQQRLPQLIISIGLSFALLQLLRHFPPHTVAHILFPNSYLPITSLWFLCWWYFGSFLLQSGTRGLVAASLTTLWLYTRLQLIVTPWWGWLSIVVAWLLLEIVTAKIKAHRI